MKTNENISRFVICTCIFLCSVVSSCSPPHVKQVEPSSWGCTDKRLKLHASEKPVCPHVNHAPPVEVMFTEDGEYVFYECFCLR